MSGVRTLVRPGQGGSASPPSLAGPQPGLYSCGCRGFRENNPIHFCLRCLDTWVAGLPGVFSGKRLQREMRKAAGILARRLAENPELGRTTLNDALNASETLPRRN